MRSTLISGQRRVCSLLVIGALSSLALSPPVPASAAVGGGAFIATETYVPGLPAAVPGCVPTGVTITGTIAQVVVGGYVGPAVFNINPSVWSSVCTTGEDLFWGFDFAITGTNLAGQILNCAPSIGQWNRSLAQVVAHATSANCNINGVNTGLQTIGLTGVWTPVPPAPFASAVVTGNIFFS